MSLLHTWHGYTDADYPLRFLRRSFRESYEESIRRHGSRLFLRWYGRDGSRLEKTFSDFATDVRGCRAFLRLRRNDARVLVTLSGNTYANAVFLVSGLLEEMIICPLNGDDDLSRLQKRFESLTETLLLVSDRARDFGRPVLSMDWGNLPPVAELAPQRSTSDTAVYIFTSGTTGYSKIVQQREFGLLVNIDSLIGLHGLQDGKKIATSLPLFHVNALEFSFFSCLLSGSEITLHENFDFTRTVTSLVDDGIEIYSGIPSILKIFRDGAARLPMEKLKLQSFVTAAAPLSPALAREASELFPFKIIQGYGLSEAINFSTLIPPSLPKGKVDRWLTTFPTPSIGTPLDGNDVAIVNDQGELQPEETTGQLAVHGLNVMKGYKNGDGSEFQHERLLTGDLGLFRRCPDTGRDFFFITGRIKDIIKRGGETLSLKEVDDALGTLIPADVILIAVGFPHDTQGEELGAVLFAPHWSDQQRADLTEAMEKNLAATLRPRVLIPVSEPPTTESGKPRRWVHTPLFAPFKTRLLGSKVLLGKS